MIVCSCKATSDRDIKRAIKDGARTLDQVAKKCGAGGGCGACHEFICDMLESKKSHCSSCDCKFAKEQAA